MYFSEKVAMPCFYFECSHREKKRFCKYKHFHQFVRLHALCTPTVLVPVSSHFFVNILLCLFIFVFVCLLFICADHSNAAVI